MARDDDDNLGPKKSGGMHHTVGEALDALSIEELGERIALLRAEIDRIEIAVAQKRASLNAAALFFKADPS